MGGILVKAASVGVQQAWSAGAGTQGEESPAPGWAGMSRLVTGGEFVR